MSSNERPSESILKIASMRAPAAYEVIPCCGDALLDKLMVVSKIERKNTKCQNYTRHASPRT